MGGCYNLITDNFSVYMYFCFVNASVVYEFEVTAYDDNSCFKFLTRFEGDEFYGAKVYKFRKF